MFNPLSVVGKVVAWLAARIGMKSLAATATITIFGSLLAAGFAGYTALISQVETAMPAELLTWIGLVTPANFNLCMGVLAVSYALKFSLETTERLARYTLMASAAA